MSPTDCHDVDGVAFKRNNDMDATCAWLGDESGFPFRLPRYCEAIDDHEAQVKCCLTCRNGYPPPATMSPTTSRHPSAAPTKSPTMSPTDCHDVEGIAFTRFDGQEETCNWLSLASGYPSRLPRYCEAEGGHDAQVKCCLTCRNGYAGPY